MAPRESHHALAELLEQAAKAEDPVAALKALVELRAHLGGVEAARVSEALAAGRSFGQIGDALGVSRQAVHRRYAGRTPADTPAERKELVVTRRARQAVEYARGEARALRSPEVRLEHLLLGLLRDDRGPAADALGELRLSLPQVRREVERLYDEGALPRPPRFTGEAVRPPVSAEARRAFEQALREAVTMNQAHLGVEHVLLALVRFEGGGAALALDGLGVSAEKVEREVERAIA